MRFLTAVCLIVLSVSASALQMMLDERAILEAMILGQSRVDRDRAQAHEPYRLKVGKAPVDWIDVVTPFHRVMMAAEARMRAGALFSQREAFATLREAPGQIVLVAELTFHPLNTFVAAPEYGITLTGPRGTVHRAIRIDRYPRFQPRIQSLTPELPISSGSVVLGKGEPILGATMVATFDATALDPQGLYTLMVADAGAELARVGMDLSKMR